VPTFRLSGTGTARGELQTIPEASRLHQAKQRPLPMAAAPTVPVGAAPGAVHEAIRRRSNTSEAFDSHAGWADRAWAHAHPYSHAPLPAVASPSTLAAASAVSWPSPRAPWSGSAPESPYDLHQQPHQHQHQPVYPDRSQWMASASTEARARPREGYPSPAFGPASSARGLEGELGRLELDTSNSDSSASEEAPPAPTWREVHTAPPAPAPAPATAQIRAAPPGRRAGSSRYRGVSLTRSGHWRVQVRLMCGFIIHSHD
jgi:hypothetical protein